MKTLILLLSAAAAWAGVDVPRTGLVISADTSAREVSGVVGSFVLGSPLASAVRSVMYSGGFGVMKLENTVRLANGAEFDAPVGDAVLGPAADGKSAYIYFAADGSFARVTPDGLEPFFVNASLLVGEVIAIADTTIFVRRPDGLYAVRVRTRDGAVISDTALGFDAVAVIASGDGTLVYATADSLVVRASDATERRIPMQGVQRLILMGDGWVQVITDGSSRTVVRIRPDALSAFELPEAAQ
jgi:hypothetical protein